MDVDLDSDDPVTPCAGGAEGRAATPPHARAIKRRLLERVADADDSHLTIGADDGNWQVFGDGVRIKVLHERDGVLSYLLQLAPGARLPPHRHPQDEECIVLEGTLQVGTRIELGPGGYHLAHQGALHATVSTRSGATIFLRGSVPEAQHGLV
jgi:quercetin dioxygenase-like cupin family protein